MEHVHSEQGHVQDRPSHLLHWRLDDRGPQPRAELRVHRVVGAGAAACAALLAVLALGGQEVRQEMGGCEAGHLVAQRAEHVALHRQDIPPREAVGRGVHQLVHLHRLHLLELGGDKRGARAGQLQALAVDLVRRDVAVEDLDSEVGRLLPLAEGAVDVDEPIDQDHPHPRVHPPACQVPRADHDIGLPAFHLPPQVGAVGLDEHRLVDEDPGGRALLATGARAIGLALQNGVRDVPEDPGRRPGRRHADRTHLRVDGDGDVRRRAAVNLARNVRGVAPANVRAARGAAR
mmetsp:Transcript_29162/g.83714  ORF Transcript_29162/g.83714 Transcript_29162/m.83714 type:complete len:290 (+) Transcript_29162:342-1211(+)